MPCLQQSCRPPGATIPRYSRFFPHIGEPQLNCVIFPGSALDDEARSRSLQILQFQS